MKLEFGDIKFIIEPTDTPQMVNLAFRAFNDLTHRGGSISAFSPLVLDFEETESIDLNDANDDAVNDDIVVNSEADITIVNDDIDTINDDTDTKPTAAEIEKINDAFENFRRHPNDVRNWVNVYEYKDGHHTLLSNMNGVEKLYPHMKSHFKYSYVKSCYKRAYIQSMLCLIKVCDCCKYWFHVSEFSAYFQHTARCKHCNNHRNHSGNRKRCDAALNDIIDPSDSEE